MKDSYDVIVVGGGHAGIEACLACANRGFSTLLICLNFKMAGNMPCNPSIGGSAKGIIVREIDSLGGYMGIAADNEYLQMKMLNTAKGPGVQCLRAQADKKRYPHFLQEHLSHTKNLDILEGIVTDIIHDDNSVHGVIIKDQKIYGKAVILATGTYMDSDILRGHTKFMGGPDGEQPSLGLSDSLRKMNIELIRLKTGTPQRIAKESIDFTKTEIQYGNVEDQGLSYETTEFIKIKDQIPCWLIYTTPETHQIIRDHLQESAMYGGMVHGVGPRYCPSIEDKIVRFSDKPRHQLFLEPESYDTNSIYLQGFSTSMPENIQDLMVHSLPGLEHAKILKYAYAIEYDALDPTQLKQSLETKIIENLFTAGQINGTSGYEEAACQGLIAGINASLKIDNKEPLILKRNEAYIGVLIDDLVTKGVIDPYRLLTSRAEYHLLLRTDNADMRLREYGHQVGLIDNNRYNKFLEKCEEIEKLTLYLKQNKITPTKENNEKLNKYNSTSLKDGISLYNLLKRPEMNLEIINEFVNIEYPKSVQEQVEINIKYEGYISKALEEANKMVDLDNKKIPEDINYDKIHNLASKAKQKLNNIRPTSIGQALRISGVNTADISLIMIYIKKEYHYD